MVNLYVGGGSLSQLLLLPCKPLGVLLVSRVLPGFVGLVFVFCGCQRVLKYGVLCCFGWLVWLCVCMCGSVYSEFECTPGIGGP